jgi:hypothetical protein
VQTEEVMLFFVGIESIKSMENVRPELIQKSWSKLLIQFDDGWSEDENLPLSQRRNKIHLANIVRDIANFVRDTANFC